MKYLSEVYCFFVALATNVGLHRLLFVLCVLITRDFPHHLLLNTQNHFVFRTILHVQKNENEMGKKRKQARHLNWRLMPRTKTYRISNEIQSEVQMPSNYILTSSQ